MYNPLPVPNAFAEKHKTEIECCCVQVKVSVQEENVF